MTGIWRFAEWLPKVSSSHQVSLGEGNTPLINSRSIAKELGLAALYLKLESTNPTGSYKDRISALAVSLALATGKSGCIGTSSGNAGASAAAYAARAGLPCDLYVLEQIVETKLIQAALHRAKIQRIKGFGVQADVGDAVFGWVEKQAKARNLEVMITAYRYNSLAMEAVQTISLEVSEQLPMSPSGYTVFVPVGGGGLFTGIAKGYRKMKEAGRIEDLPVFAAVQSEGCQNIVRAWRNGKGAPSPGDSTSRISGLQVPNPPDGEAVLDVLHREEGFGTAVADEEVWQWQEKLAFEEGIWCEPAGAVSVAGAAQAVREGRLKRGDTAVCLVTGAGFKDGDRAAQIVRGLAEIPLVDIKELQH